MTSSTVDMHLTHHGETEKTIKSFLTGSQQASIELPRREFLRATAAGLAVTGFCGSPIGVAVASEDPEIKPETLVTQRYKALTEDQKKLMAFDFEDPLRQEIDNNWHITKAVIGQTFDKDQQGLIRDIFMGLHSEEYAETVMKQVEHDNGNTNRTGGFQGCSIALFGTPGTGKFEFVLTGRHVTRRMDRDSVEAAAFWHHSAKPMWENR